MYYILMYTKYINNISEIVASYKKNEKIRNEKSNAIIEKLQAHKQFNKKPQIVHTYLLYLCKSECQIVENCIEMQLPIEN